MKIPLGDMVRVVTRPGPGRSNFSLRKVNTCLSCGDPSRTLLDLQVTNYASLTTPPPEAIPASALVDPPLAWDGRLRHAPDYFPQCVYGIVPVPAVYPRDAYVELNGWALPTYGSSGSGDYIVLQLGSEPDTLLPCWILWVYSYGGTYGVPQTYTWWAGVKFPGSSGPCYDPTGRYHKSDHLTPPGGGWNLDPLDELIVAYRSPTP